MPDNF